MKNFIIAILILLCFEVQNYPVIDTCQDALYSGAYSLKLGDKQVDLECDADTDGGGWHTILMRRGGYESFYQNWNTYAHEGIGSPQTEYFLPLQFISELTTEETYELLIEMKEGQEYAWALYRTFQVRPESENFKLLIGDQDAAGTAGDGFQWHNNKKFTTYDRDNDMNDDLNCASQRKTAGWFGNCFYANLFGQYENCEIWKGIVYYPRFSGTTSMDVLSFKIRKSKCLHGFGSTCSGCLPDYHFPVYQTYLRPTCLRECTLSHCEICSPKIYPFCAKCETGYVPNEKGECIAKVQVPDPETPCECDQGNTPVELANCTINFYNYNSKIENVYVKSKEANVHLKPEP